MALCFLSPSRASQRFARRRGEALQFIYRLVQPLFLVLGRALETCRRFHQAAFWIDDDFKVRANERARQVLIVDPQSNGMRAILGRKLRLIDWTKTGAVWRAQLLGNGRFRGLEFFSFVTTAGQDDGQRQDIN